MQSATNPFVCRICGKGLGETELSSVDTSNSFFICADGFGCRNISESVFRGIYRRLYFEGKDCSPKGLRTKEIENFTCVIPPYVRFVNFDVRNLNISYIKREFLWYLKGDKFDLSIINYAKMWKDLVEKNGEIYSNYGQYIFNLKQFDNAANILLNDKDSRRAAMVILQPYHLLDKEAKEIPCTYSLSFRIRNNYINMSVNMRSQDAWIGFGSDIPCFSFIHEMMFLILKEKYTEIKYGKYFHNVDSFHIYEKHFEKMNSIVKNKSSYKKVFCPKISGADEVRFLLNGDFSVIPEEFRFARWLNTF